MRLIEGHDATVAEFVANLSPIERPVWAPGYRAFGVVRDDGELVAGVVFSDWYPPAKRVQLSGAAIDARAFGLRILGQLGHYVFGQLDANRIWARTSIDNRRARKLLKGLGFIEEGVQASWYAPGEHAVLCRVMRSEWERKWPTWNPVRRAA